MVHLDKRFYDQCFFMRNIVLKVCKVKIPEYFYVGASVNTGNDKVDLCK